ncbi:MAG: diheme cytochrome c [Oleibacter sp.]|nr:diheme cytochrome c [Thalassolituus sp.]
MNTKKAAAMFVMMSKKNTLPTPKSPGTSTADATRYQEECGSCHLAYPAKLLPARSWHQIMTTLPDHFGDDASLDEGLQAEILAYLSAHSASNKSRMMKGVGYDDVPLRITELNFFTRKHRKIPERMVQGNPEVGSFTQCNACHGSGAVKGKFNEHTVDIPGFGRWDD